MTKKRAPDSVPNLIAGLNHLRERFDRAADKGRSFYVMWRQDADGPHIQMSPKSFEFVTLARGVEPLLSQADPSYDTSKGRTADGRLLRWVFSRVPTDPVLCEQGTGAQELTDNPFRVVALAISAVVAGLQEASSDTLWSKADLPAQFCRQLKINRTSFYRLRKAGGIRSRPAGGKLIQVYLPDLKKFRE